MVLLPKDLYMTDEINLPKCGLGFENAKRMALTLMALAVGLRPKYTNEDGETIFVEIKSTSGTGISFMITENELNFAETHNAI